MSKVGPQLKQAREAQQKTRADVARETGILIHDLAALEYGSFDDLADDVTAAGLVKAYAEYLGFRPDEPVAEFWAERGVDPPPPLAQAHPVEPPAESSPATHTLPWGFILAGAAVVVLIVVLIVVAFVVRGTAERPQPAAGPAMQVAPSADDAQPAPDATPPVPRDEPARPPGPQPRQPVAADPAPASRLRVTEHAVGTAVENRRLVGESDRFRIGRRVWFWTRVEGGRAGDRIRHVWIRDGREIATVELRVGSPNWRTQSAKTLVESSIGRWVVEARDASGRVLARDEFVCEP